MTERPLGVIENITSDEYILRDGVFLISGSLRGAVYDTNTGKVFSLNRSGYEILKGNVVNSEFLKKLESINLITKEKTKRKAFLPEKLGASRLEFVWFEIVSDDCNESCIHCYAECMPKTYRKEMGLSGEKARASDKKEKEEKITFEKWKQLIDESYSLGCRRCQFIGGEPLLYKGEGGETLFDLAEHAKSLGFEFIEVFTNGTLLTEEKVKKIKDLHLNIAISLYSIDEKIHEAITKTPGSFRKTMNALNMLKDNEVPTRVETVLMGPNEKTIKETQTFVEKMGFSHKQPDVLRPSGRGENLSIMPTKETVVNNSLMLSPNFTVNTDTLVRNISGHPCLSGKITISDNGDVLPCIFSRNTIVGSVREKNLKEIISDTKLETIWQSTKDNVLVCQDCEYRYACFDCRPISKGANGANGEYLTAPYSRCTYNPYTGEWAKGVWRVDDKGKPYYDETLKPDIGKLLNQDNNKSSQTIRN